MAEPGRRGRPPRLGMLLAALVGAALLAGCGGGPVAGIQGPDNHGYVGTYVDPPYRVSGRPLTATDGSAFALSGSTAPLQVVFFGYTHCPDICQIMMSTITAAVTKLSPAQRAGVQVVFVTTDPARDTSGVLRSYLDRFYPGYVGLTGSLNQILAVAAPMKVYIDQGKKLSSGGYEVDHSTYVFGVRHGGVRVIWSQGTSPAEMAADMIRLLKS